MGIRRPLGVYMGSELHVGVHWACGGRLVPTGSCVLALVGVGLLQSLGEWLGQSSFRVGWRTAGGVQFLFFRRFLLGLAKLSFWGGDWMQGNNSMKFGDFCDISQFPNILGLKSFCNSWGNQFITNNHASFHLWGKKNVPNHQKFSKYYEHNCRSRWSARNKNP